MSQNFKNIKILKIENLFLVPTFLGYCPILDPGAFFETLLWHGA
jgi:hypothetical protein